MAIIAQFPLPHLVVTWVKPDRFVELGLLGRGVGAHVVAARHQVPQLAARDGVARDEELREDRVQVPGDGQAAGGNTAGLTLLLGWQERWQLLLERNSFFLFTLFDGKSRVANSKENASKIYSLDDS